MSEFKNFIKGFEEKPEAKNPNPAPTPKPQEIKIGEPKVEESGFSKSRPAFTHDFAESLRKDAINWANEKLPYDKSLPKILNNYTRDEVIDFMRGNIGEDEIMKRAKERNGINQDRVNLLAKQEAQQTQPKEGSFEKMMQGLQEPKTATEKKAEQYHEPKPKVEMDEDYERSWGPEQKKDGYYKDNKGEIYLVEHGDTYYPVNEVEKTEFFNAFNKQAKEAPKAEQPQTNIPANFFDKPEDAAYDYFGKSFEKAEWGDNAYTTKDGEEWWIGTEDEAYQAAKEDINDFLESEGIIGFTDEFRNWIVQNAIDEKFISEVQDEEADYYEQDGDAGTANAIRSMNKDEFAEYLKMNLGEREFYDMIKRNKAYDADKIADEAIAWDDGVAHFIGRYDGREYQLPNGFVAYRQN